MIRDLLLGKKIIKSRAEFKYALLRAQLSFLLGGICFVYIFIDIFNRVLVYIPWYFAGIVIAIFAIQQNRKGNYLIASVILLIAANMLVFLIASLEDTQGGAFFYFVATSATGLVVLNPALYHSFPNSLPPRTCDTAKIPPCWVHNRRFGLKNGLIENP